MLLPFEGDITEARNFSIYYHEILKCYKRKAGWKSGAFFVTFLDEMLFFVWRNFHSRRQCLSDLDTS